MPHVDNEVLIDAPREKVYALAKDLASFPDFMPDVESIHIVTRSDDGLCTVADWVGVAREFKLKVRWTEEDVWDDKTHTCRFRQIKGDYTSYGGLWTFRATSDGRTRFISSLDYELDIPLVGPLLKKVVARLMQSNAQKILEAIKHRAEIGGTTRDAQL